MSTPQGFLLDTNVVSDSFKRRGSSAVASSVRDTPEESLYISVLTLGEVRRGVLRKPGATKLQRWADDLEEEFETRVLPITLSIAQRWAEISAGRTLSTVDSLLAATALVHNLTLVTRNTRDVADTGVTLPNPWA